MSIRFNIDQIKNESIKKCLIIKGWAFDNSLKTQVSIYCEANNNIIDFQLKRTVRFDVEQKFYVPAEQQVGFTIKLFYKEKKGNSTITLEKKQENKKIIIDLEHETSINKKNILHRIERIKEDGLISLIKSRFTQVKPVDEYRYWINIIEAKQPKIDLDQLVQNPLISIIVPVYNVEGQYLKDCIESVVNQSYPNWELCIADDCSTNADIRPILEKYSSQDERIKVVFREKNGHICEASNSALALATGEYIGLLDNDDLLAAKALVSVVDIINKHPDAEFIYSDEDKIDQNGKRTEPFFKPDWSQDTFLSTNYVCHFTVIKKALIEKVGGFEKGLEGSQDYDLFLKCTEQTNHIYHIPQILYHWRIISGSTASNPKAKLYAYEAGLKAIENAFARRSITANVVISEISGYYQTSYAVHGNPKVSVLIPTKDHVDDLKCCIDSIFNTAGYEKFEIIVINNNSEEDATKTYFETLQKQYPNQVRILNMPIPFNYSKLNNEAAKMAKGDYLLLLNNDVEMLTENWMPIMIGYAQQDRIGAVGIKLLYPDETIQHAGTVLGMGGIAAHAFEGFEKNSTIYFNRLNIVANYSAVTAACLMVKKEKYFQVGGLNEIDLKVAYNDVDFCIKLKESGYDNVCLPQVEAYHFESKSRGKDDTPEKQVRFERESKYMYQTWGELIDNDPCYNVNLSLKSVDFRIKI